jgi:hypothetical protein
MKLLKTFRLVYPIVTEYLSLYQSLDNRLYQTRNDGYGRYPIAVNEFSLAIYSPNSQCYTDYVQALLMFGWEEITTHYVDPSGAIIQR